MPGARNGWVLVKDAAKHPRPDEAPYPAGLRPNKTEEDKAAEAKAAKDKAEEAATESAELHADSETHNSLLLTRYS